MILLSRLSRLTCLPSVSVRLNYGARNATGSRCVPHQRFHVIMTNKPVAKVPASILNQCFLKKVPTCDPFFLNTIPCRESTWDRWKSVYFLAVKEDE